MQLINNEFPSNLRKRKKKDRCLGLAIYIYIWEREREILIDYFINQECYNLIYE
jgi:hypothetical protein